MEQKAPAELVLLFRLAEESVAKVLKVEQEEINQLIHRHYIQHKPIERPADVEVIVAFQAALEGARAGMRAYAAGLAGEPLFSPIELDILGLDEEAEMINDGGKDGD